LKKHTFKKLSFTDKIQRWIRYAFI